MDVAEKDINFSNHPDLLLVVDTVAREKGIEKEEVFDAMEQALSLIHI